LALRPAPVRAALVQARPSVRAAELPTSQSSRKCHGRVTSDIGTVPRKPTPRPVRRRSPTVPPSSS